MLLIPASLRPGLVLPGEALAKLVSLLPRSPGRRKRRSWAHGGRAHIELRGAGRPRIAEVARDVETALARLPAVRWAQVNAITGRVAVAFDEDQADVGCLVEVIEGVEEARGLAGERFPHDRPEHPCDIEPMRRHWYALGADIGGLGIGLASRLVRVNPLLGEAASLVSLVEATPILHGPLHARLGRTTADLGLAAASAIAQGLAHGPLGILVDIAYRGLRIDELSAQRALWARRESALSPGPTARPWPTWMPERPAPLPAGPVESYSARAAAVAVAASAATAVITRDPQLMVATTAAANPKPARLGREAFAARLGRDLARSGVLVMDADALRRLDRVDTVVLDAQALTTGEKLVSSVWVPPQLQAEAEQALLAAHALLARGDDPPRPPRGLSQGDDPPRPSRGLSREDRGLGSAGPCELVGQAGAGPAGAGLAGAGLAGAGLAGAGPAGAGPAGAGLAGAGLAARAARRGAPAQVAGCEWAIAPVPANAPDVFADAARHLRARQIRPLALLRGGELVGLVISEPGLDPLAEALIEAARRAGAVVLAGPPEVGEKARADRIVAGGTSTARSVRALQADGAVVALVSAHQHEALMAADVGIGIPAGPVAPWGAHLITGLGLADACHVLEAIPAARTVSRRAVALAEYGSGTGAALGLTGQRSRAASRAMLGVNGAAIASMSSGAWSAMTLARRPPPMPTQTTPWHALQPAAVLDRLSSSDQGLGQDEADLRRAAQPEGAERAEPGVIRASLEELANPLTPALACGAGLAAAAGSITDAMLIGSFMGANALVSGIQRVSVGHALRRLIDKSAVRVRLRRGGAEGLTTAGRLVPGDVIVLETGDAVPADCRILDALGLEVDESSLTGESQLVAKDASPTSAASMAERTSMLYAGSSVAAGTARAVVVATGQATELGRSTQASDGGQRSGGVQARLTQLARLTVPTALGAGAAVLGTGLLRGRSVRDTLGTGVSLAVAAVPEGLPIVATAAQYAAARRLSRRNALVRNPGMIEALGRVDVLCFDKTGTLTKGRIRLQRVWTLRGEQPLTDLAEDGKLAIAIGLRATPERDNRQRLPHATDRAVTKGAKAAGVTAQLGAKRWRQVGELPFEPSRGYHAVLGRAASGQRLAVKGAPETVLPLCSLTRSGNGTIQLDEPTRRVIAEAADRLARLGYRVLAVAERTASSRHELREDRIGQLGFAGLLALTDPVRDTAAQAIRGLRAAQVDVLMLTGDHPSTAEAIAAELDLLNDHRVVTGPELDAASEATVDELVRKAAVFARVSPDNKVRIVTALRRVGRVVAVTGDGANDAPAIRLADVGVALGKRGTNAAKEAADVVVTDDKLETIIDAISEGRAMWSSVREAIAMLLGGNLGEIAFTVGASLLLPGGSPLNARQLLLVNLFTDMIPSLALAVRAPTSTTPDVLLREGPDVSLGSALTREILIRGGLTATAGAAGWLGGRLTGITPRHAGTTALIAIVGAQLGQTLVAGWRSPLVVAASLGSVAVLAGVIQTPVVSQVFGCTPLGPVGWGVGLGAATAASLGAPLASRLAPQIA